MTEFNHEITPEEERSAPPLPAAVQDGAPNTADDIGYPGDDEITVNLSPGRQPEDDLGGTPDAPEAVPQHTGAAAVRAMTSDHTPRATARVHRETAQTAGEAEQGSTLPPGAVIAARYAYPRPDVPPTTWEGSAPSERPTSAEDEPPERPLVNVRPAGMAIARRTEEVARPDGELERPGSPVLAAETTDAGGVVLAFYNQDEGVGSVVHLRSGAMLVDMQAATRQVREAAPELETRDTSIHIFGATPGPEAQDTVGGVNPEVHIFAKMVRGATVVHTGPQVAVAMETDTGRVTAVDTSATAAQPPEVYTHTPPAPREGLFSTEEPYGESTDIPRLELDVQSGAPYVHSLSEVASELTPPPSLIASTNTRAEEVMHAYAERSAGLTTPAQRATALSDLCSSHSLQMAIEEIVTLVHRNHPILKELEPTPGDDSLVRQLLGARLTRLVDNLTALEQDYDRYAPRPAPGLTERRAHIARTKAFYQSLSDKLTARATPDSE